MTQVNTNSFKSSLAALVLVLLSVDVQAQNSPLPDFERKLKQRDNAIIELLERIEALEQRVGVPRLPEEPDKSLQQNNATPINNESTLSPGAVVIEEGAAERALERSLTRSGALLLPPGVVEIETGFTYGRQEDTSPSFVMSNNQVIPSEIERNINNLTLDIALRLGLPWDSQLEIGLPYRWREVELVTNINFLPTAVTEQSDEGKGDVRVGFAKTLFRENLWRPDIVGRITWDSDSGDTGGFEELRGSLTMIKRQDPLTFIGGLAFESTSSNGQVKPGSAISVSFGTYIALSPETSLRFLFAGTHQDETELGGKVIAGSDRDVASFVIGGSSLVARGTLINLSTSIGLTDDADDFTITLSLPIRLDGRIF